MTAADQFGFFVVIPLALIAAGVLASVVLRCRIHRTAAEVARVKSERDFCDQAARESQRDHDATITDLQEARAELARVKAERDDALMALALEKADRHTAATELAALREERDSGAGKCTPEHTWKEWTELELLRKAELRFLGNGRAKSYSVKIGDLERCQVVFFPPNDRLEMIKNPEAEARK